MALAAFNSKVVALFCYTILLCLPLSVVLYDLAVFSWYHFKDLAYEERWLLCFDCFEAVFVLCLFLMVTWIGLQSMIVVILTYFSTFSSSPL